MSYSLGDGDKLKMRLSHTRDAAFVVVDELLKLASEALQSEDEVMYVAILDCTRKIRDAVQELREKIKSN